jgi:hypothetical protein
VAAQLATSLYDAWYPCILPDSLDASAVWMRMSTLMRLQVPSLPAMVKDLLVPERISKKRAGCSRKFDTEVAGDDRKTERSTMTQRHDFWQ